VEKRVNKVKFEYNYKKIRAEVRKHGPVKIYTPEEVRALNVARGLVVGDNHGTLCASVANAACFTR